MSGCQEIVNKHVSLQFFGRQLVMCRAEVGRVRKATGMRSLCILVAARSQLRMWLSSVPFKHEYVLSGTENKFIDKTSVSIKEMQSWG